MLRHVLDEQPDIDWCFKTSLVFVKGFNTILEQTPIDKASQIDNIISYINEAKPYHTNFSGLTEQHSAPQEAADIDVTEIVNPTIKLHFDRISCETDLPGYDTVPYDYNLDSNGEEIGYDNFDLTQVNLNHAANRIYLYYTPGSDEEKKSLEDLMDCDFRGLLVSGGEINIDEIGYDSNFFEKYGYDVPVREAYYQITSSPTLDFTDYETLIDAVSETDDYGSIASATTETLDWGSITTPVPAPASAVTFPLPYVIFETKKVLVYYDQADGSRGLTTDPYTVIGFNVVFDTPPPVGVTIFIAVIDYDYLYDKIYATSADWTPASGDQEITLDSAGFIRPHWDRNHPQELSPVRVLENLDIRVFTNQAQVLGSDPGYDEAPYDTFGYDLAEDDLSLSTGGGPEAVTESFYKSEISDVFELGIRPQSDEAVFVFEDGLLTSKTSDYTVSWSEPTHDDTSERDDHITNPRVSLVSPPSSTTPVTFLSYGIGGATVRKHVIEYDTNQTSFNLGITLTSTDEILATVNGQIATITATTSTVNIVSPSVPPGSTVEITVFNDSSFTLVRSQFETGTAVTLNNPPSSTVPGYMGIQAWDLTTGFRLNGPYTKVHLAKAGEDTYASSGPSGSYVVYLDGEIQTDTVDYNVSGTDIVFTSIPSLDAEIIIQQTGTGEFSLSTVTIANDTFTLIGKDYLTLEDGSGVVLLENGDQLLLEAGSADSTDLRIVTFPEDISTGIRTECYRGVAGRQYDVGGTPSVRSQLWVYLDGVLQHEGKDYRYSDTGTRTVIFLDTTVSHLNSVIQITYFTERTASRPLGFRITRNPTGEYQFLRIADKHTTELTNEYRSGIDAVIRVKDASVLGQPSPITVPAKDRIPGRIWIDGELIEFWGINYNITPHQLTNLRPGSHATGMGLTHPVGSAVIDASLKQEIPVKITVNTTDSRVNHQIQNAGILSHTILGEVRDQSKVKVWVNAATTLVEDFNADSSSLTVTDATVFNLPGSTTLQSDVAAASGSILSGDRLRLRLNDGSYEFVTLSGDDATSVKTDIESSPLLDKGLTVTVVSDVIGFNHSGGGDLVIENESGYALQDLFGGQVSGSVTTPTVSFGSGEGITINGENIVFSAADLSTVISDINSAGISSIVARDKNDSLQLVHLQGGAITLANLVGSALTELGVSSSSASTILEINGTILQAVGDRSTTKGTICLDQERIQFGWYDPSIEGMHIIGDLTRDFIGIDPAISYSAGKTIVGSNQMVKTRGADYNIIGQQIKFVNGLQPTVGSLIRIQNTPDTGKLVIPNDIQTSNSAISRFLREKPGNVVE
jgi:hypothetical protein